MDEEEELFSSEQQDLQCAELRDRIKVNQVDVQRMAQDMDRLKMWIVEGVGKARGLIELNQKQQLKFGLVHLKEAERVLEYAASSGRSIERSLIIAVLHNQAAVYQKLWQLSNCSSYLEGIIFNYDNFIKEASVPGSVLMPADPHRLGLKVKLARYHLQYCAVNSQLNQHDAALVSVFKAHSLMIQCVSHSMEEIMTFSVNSEHKMEQCLLERLCQYDKCFQEATDLTQLANRLSRGTYFSLQIWETAKSKSQQSIGEFLSNYSIGNIVEIIAAGYDGQEGLGVSYTKEEARQQHPLNKIVLLSACYFSRATQLRLKSAHIYKRNPQQRKSSKEYRLSISYHLLSIIVASCFVPYELKYLHEILLSYEKHYSVNLSDYKTIENASFAKIAETLKISLQPSVPASPKRESPPTTPSQPRNQYNMKINFEPEQIKKLDKVKSLKKLTKQLNSPQRTQHKDMKSSRSKDNKTSFSITKKKERTLSRHDTGTKLVKAKSAKEGLKYMVSQKAVGTTTKVKAKKSPQPVRSRPGQEKSSKQKHMVDETQQLFFCFSKKTKKTHGTNQHSNNHARSSSIASNHSKNSKRNSLLSPKKPTKIQTPKMQTPKMQTPKMRRSPGRRKNLGDLYV